MRRHQRHPQPARHRGHRTVVTKRVDLCQAELGHDVQVAERAGI
jgi:hypothetical protein